jgi:hypothetical protein
MHEDVRRFGADSLDRIGAKEVFARANFETRETWHQYANHRRKVHGVLSRYRKSPNDTIAIIGAGNGNDLSYRVIARQFSKAFFIDPDGSSLIWGFENQFKKRKKPTNIHLFPHHVVLGNGLQRLPVKDTLEGGFESLTQTLNTPMLDQVKASIVLSPCVLSQLLTAISLEIGLPFCRPNAVSPLVRDFVRGILEIADTQSTLILLLDRSDQVSTAHFPFHSPTAIMVYEWIKQDSLLSARISEVTFLSKWKWRRSPYDVRLVDGLVILTSSEDNLSY